MVLHALSNETDDSLVIEGLGQLTRNGGNTDVEELPPHVNFKVTHRATGREFEVNVLAPVTTGTYTYVIAEDGCPNDLIPMCSGDRHTGTLAALCDICQMLEDGKGALSRDWRAVYGRGVAAESAGNVR